MTSIWPGVVMGPSEAPSLWAALDRDDDGSRCLSTWNGDGYDSWSWGEWLQAALRFSGGLRRAGVQPGDRVACLLTNSQDACVAVFGVWLTGACLVSLPLMARGMAPSAYVAQLRTCLAQAAPELLLCDEAYAQVLEDAELEVRTSSFQRMGAGHAVSPTLVGPDVPIFVQYTSGSTTEPRGCVLTAGAIARQLAMLDRALEMDPERDVAVIWLPLSHDMGLFGCLALTYWVGDHMFLGTPQRFLAQPSSWFEDCARFGATISAAPSFALDVATRVAAKRLPPPFPMRRLVVGSDRVDAGTLRRATSVLGEERLRASALTPAYGLAEAVLAVTMTPLSEAPRILRVDPEALSRGEVRPTDDGRELVSAGRPLAGCEVGTSGRDAGEIVVRSVSLAEGYLGAPEATAERFTADGLLTRDIGFLSDGDLYVAGRVDDLLLLAGRNVYARDIEAALTDVSGLRPGGYSVVDVDREGSPELVVVAEPRPHHPDLHVIAGEIAMAARTAAGVMVGECVFVERGQLPKTPSGKVQRYRCREIAADGHGIRIRP